MLRIASLLAIIFSLSCQAQDSTRIFIAAGQTVGEAVPKNKIYKYPAFTKGQISFRDGSLTQALLNYNFLNGEIEFIAPNGDTLAIAKPQMLTIKQISLDTQKFYYADGYLQEVMTGTQGKLLKKEQYKVLKREKIGAYDQPSSTSAIESYSSFVIDSQFQPNLTIKQSTTLVKVNEYFFGDAYSTFLRATRKNVLKAFPKKKVELEGYLKTNVVDFNKEQDLMKLMLFLQA